MSDKDGIQIELGIPLDEEAEPSEGEKSVAEEPNERSSYSAEDQEQDRDFENEDSESIDLGMVIEETEEDSHASAPEKAENSIDTQRPADDSRPDQESVASGEACLAGEASAENNLADKLDCISCKIDALQDEFLEKLKNDTYKDKLIDALHRELQDYKNDLVKKHVQSMVMDVIKIIDDIRKLSEHYQSMDEADLEPVKLLRLLRRIPDDLEDLFFYQGVKPFSCQGTEFDPTRQRVLKRVETDDSALDKTVAESLRPGYEWDGKVIRPEFVAVYLYKKPSADEKIGTSDE